MELCGPHVAISPAILRSSNWKVRSEGQAQLLEELARGRGWRAFHVDVQQQPRHRARELRLAQGGSRLLRLQAQAAAAQLGVAVRRAGHRLAPLPLGQRERRYSITYMIPSRCVLFLK